MTGKRKYEVRVYRRLPQEYADIEVEAASRGEALVKAEAEARANSCLYFDGIFDPEFDAEILK